MHVFWEFSGEPVDVLVDALCSFRNRDRHDPERAEFEFDRRERLIPQQRVAADPRDEDVDLRAELVAEADDVCFVEPPLKVHHPRGTVEHPPVVVPIALQCLELASRRGRYPFGRSGLSAPPSGHVIRAQVDPVADGCQYRTRVAPTAQQQPICQVGVDPIVERCYEPIDEPIGKV